MTIEKSNNAISKKIGIIDLILFITFSFLFLLISVLKGIFILYPMFLSLCILFCLLCQRGFKFKRLLVLGIAGCKRAFSVIYILLLIGIVIAVWMTAGTVPTLVYYGIKIITPNYFILSAFILNIVVSLLIGTSFGTVSTIGIVLIIMASGSNVNLHLVVGAIIAGAYFGDRCSPMSSSANLIATITKTKIDINIKKMIGSSLLPLIISIIFYFLISLMNPVEFEREYFLEEITNLFDTSWLTLLPALVILLLAWLRIKIKLIMLISITIAVLISITMQKYSLPDIFIYSFWGFQLSENTNLRADS